MFQNILFPICFIIIIGALLRKKGIFNGDFIKNATQLMYHILLPVFFFWIIASEKTSAYFDWRVYLAAIFSILMVYLIAHIFIRIFKTSDELSFAFTNSCYRFNLLLGLSLIYYLFDKNVMREFCIFLLFLIPFTDLFTWIGAVPILKKLEMNDLYFRQSVKRIFLNPLLLAGILGLLSSSLNISLPAFVNKTLEMISSIIFPLALIMTGGALTRPRIKGINKFSVVGAGLKTILMPVLVYLFLQLFAPNMEVFYTIVPFFALPFMLDRQVVITEKYIQQDNTSQFSTISAFFSFFSLSFWCYFLLH
jgi:malonate transporter